MAILNQRASISVIPGVAAQTVVHLSQGNVGDTVTFEVYAGSEPFSMTNLAASCHGVRKDGVGFGPVACIISGNTVEFTITAAMTALSGPALAEIVFTNNGDATVGTANFAMLIEQGTFPDGPTYDTDISVYQQILQYVQSYPAIDQARIDAAVAAEASARAAAIDAVSDSVDAISADVTELSNTTQKKRRYILIGDSYGQGWNGEADVIGWCERFRSRSGLSASDCYIAAQGGAGFIHTPTFLSKLQDLTVSDPETITDILVVGGYNDHSATAADLGTAIDTFYTYANTTYPNAHIWIGFCGVSRATDGAIRVELDNVRTSYYNESRMLHLPDTSIFTQMYSPCYGTDDFHLSETGYNYLGDFYWAAIHGGTLKTNRSVGNLNPTFTENYSSSGQLRFWMDDDKLVISIPANYRLNVGSEKPVGGGLTKIADLPIPFLGKNGANYNSLPVTGALHIVGTGFVDMHAALSIYNKSLYLRIGNVSGNQYIDLTNLDYIIFDNATVYIPAHEIF